MDINKLLEETVQGLLITLGINARPQEEREQINSMLTDQLNRAIGIALLNELWATQNDKVKEAISHNEAGFVEIVRMAENLPNTEELVSVAAETFKKDCLNFLC